MRRPIALVTVLFLGLGGPTEAQLWPAAPVGPMRQMSGFHATGAPTSRSAAVKRGMIIGGVTGAGVAAILVFSHPCHGDECWTRSAVAILPIGLGGAVGILVGGAVGNATAQDREFEVGGGTVERARPFAVAVGIRLTLPRLH